MSISIVNVTVPASGDGPIASIANLVGEKTVELSGRFVGRYVLLGSHNGADFVPVLIFDANGEESIKQTLPLAVSSVRVRAHASSPVGVTMNVSGVLSPGANLFTPVTSLAPGASGIQAAIDLFTLFPPTGMEEDINFFCKGSFDGLITVEGSMDGVHYNPIGGFRTDSQPVSLIGSAPVLEFSPIKSNDLVRYVRLVVEGRILSTTIITVGGANPTTSLAPAPKLIELCEEEGRVAIGDTEVILYEWAINLSDLPLVDPIAVQINAIIEVTPALSQADFNVYVGSTTPGNTVGGTLRANVNTVLGTEELVTVTGVAFANPGGECLVQITGVGNYPGVLANIRAVSIAIG